MTKVELGTKRTCPNCGAKYYDLNRAPIVCPRCGTVFEVVSVKARPQAAKTTTEPDQEEEVADEAEMISLGEADEEAAKSGKVDVEVDDSDEDAEIEDEAAEDDTFLEDDEEDEDVGDIIGEVDDEER